jgi:hypothetical protein
VKEFLGSGAYGHVWRVGHRESGQEYALKKVFDAFQNDVDAQRTYREVSVLHQLDHPNIVRLEWVIKARNERDLYLVFELVEADLHSIIGYLEPYPDRTSWALPTCASSPTRCARCSSTCTRPSCCTATSSPATSSSMPTARVPLRPSSQALRLRPRPQPCIRGGLSAGALRRRGHPLVPIPRNALGLRKVRTPYRHVESRLRPRRSCHRRSPLPG